MENIKKFINVYYVYFTYTLFTTHTKCLSNYCIIRLISLGCPVNIVFLVCAVLGSLH